MQRAAVATQAAAGRVMKGELLRGPRTPAWLGALAHEGTSAARPRNGAGLSIRTA